MESWLSLVYTLAIGAGALGVFFAVSRLFPSQFHSLRRSLRRRLAYVVLVGTFAAGTLAATGSLREAGIQGLAALGVAVVTDLVVRNVPSGRGPLARRREPQLPPDPGFGQHIRQSS